MIQNLQDFLDGALRKHPDREKILDIIDSLVAFNHMTIEDQTRFLSKLVARWATQQQPKRFPRNKKTPRKRKPQKNAVAAINKILKGDTHEKPSA